jgi:hypothetical protein
VAVGVSVAVAMSNRGLNGAKIRTVWDGSRSERTIGIQPGLSPEPRHRLEAYATLVCGASSDV